MKLLLTASVILSAGCKPQAIKPSFSPATRSLVLTAALKGYEFGEKQGGWYELSNSVWNIMNTNGGGVLPGATEKVVIGTNTAFNYPTNPIYGLPTNYANGYNTAIGVMAGWCWTTQTCSMALGNGADTTNSFELVIKFLDGTELRQRLPTNTVVDLRGFWNWPKL